MTHNLKLVGVLAVLMGTVRAQEQASICYGAGSMATAIVLTFLLTLLLVGGVLYFLKRRADAKKGKFQNISNYQKLKVDWMITVLMGIPSAKGKPS